MIIKKFTGKTREDALESAKKELGDGIVEMNVKTVKPKGLFAIFQATKVEVTVAKEENERYETAFTNSEIKRAEGVRLDISQNNDKNRTASVTTFQEQHKELDGARDVGKAVAEVLSSFPADEKTKKDVYKENTYKEDSSLGYYKGENTKGQALEEKLDNLQSLIEQQISRHENKNVTEDINAEENIIDDENKERLSLLKLLYNKMVDNEINEKYANEIIDEIDKSCKPDVTMDYMLSEIYQRMILKLGKPYMIEEDRENPKVIFFIGPTGVGKTTTIAKIASMFRVEQKKKVALLTADTYRIAAAEQLRTYANILEVPFRVVYSSKEIENAINDFYEYDYILVDTTGHSPNNEAQCENMTDLINSVQTKSTKEVFLVLSASTKYRDLLKIADTYREIADYKLIFTKLDETSTIGNIYNFKMYTGASLSYITYGQNVPDDIEYFNPQATVKQLLGGKR